VLLNIYKAYPYWTRLGNEKYNSVMQKKKCFMSEYTYVFRTTVNIFVTQGFSSGIYLRAFCIINNIEAFIVDFPLQQVALR
jgi:hypothetical protein